MTTCRPACVALLVAAACGSLHADDLQQKLRTARELVVAGKSDQAIPIYEELVRSSPNDAGLLLNLSIAEFKSGRYAGAARDADAALKLQPDLLPASLFLGSSRLELGEYADAVEPLRKFVQAQPADRNARIMLGDALLALDRPEDAVGHFLKASELAPQNARAWYGLGRCFESLAERAAADLRSSAPDSAYGLALAGDSFLKQRRYGMAFSCYRQALAGNPRLRGAHSALATVYRETGHPEWAAIEERRERELPPADCSVRPVECELSASRYGELIDNLKRDSSVEARYWAGKAWSRMAADTYSRLNSLPPSFESRMHAAREYDAQGLHIEAAKAWSEALQLAPASAEAQRGLAWSLYRGRDYEAGLPVLERLLKQDPASAELNFLYGASLLNQEQPEKAVPWLEAALRHDPQLTPARAALGHALLRTGNPEQAIPHLKAGLAADEDGGIRFQLARAYQISGRAEQGKAAMAEFQKYRSEAERKRKAEEGSAISPP